MGQFNCGLFIFKSSSASINCRNKSDHQIQNNGLLKIRKTLKVRHTARYLFKRYSFYLGGDQPEVSWAERLRSCAGALVGLFLVSLLPKC